MCRHRAPTTVRAVNTGGLELKHTGIVNHFSIYDRQH